MVACGSVCLRRLGATRAGEVRFGRFLGNAKVTLARLVEGWSQSTRAAVAGRHVLALQDTSELCFHTRAGQRRGLGRIGRGRGGHGLLLHAMLAVDAGTGHACLGLVGGTLWTRPAQPDPRPHTQRALAEKESQRWLATAETARTVLAAAAQVTVVDDREGDIYAKWALLPGPTFHLLTRAAQDRRLAEGGKLFTAVAAWPEAGRRTITVPVGATAARREAKVALRHGAVRLCRPKNGRDKSLPAALPLTLVEVHEVDPPAGTTPVVWRLLTTHVAADAAAAWQIVDWYRARWLIEQLFRTLKQQGLQIEDSQVESAAALLKLAAIATHAAVITLQLSQARAGAEPGAPATRSFAAAEVATLAALGPTLEGRTAKQKNPYPPDSLPWAAWIIARLGGWKGYASERPPGPITFKRGLDTFAAIACGYALNNVCIP